MIIKRLVCWWFGCDPDYEHTCMLSANYVVPCKRCGAHDTDYADRVGDTRHNNFVRWICRLLPRKCCVCGKRWRKCADDAAHEDADIPF